MAFAYLDGTVVCDLGGVHGDSAGACVTPFNISAGPHNLEVFFVDINNVQSGLTFDVTTAGVTTTGGGGGGALLSRNLLHLPCSELPWPASLSSG